VCYAPETKCKLMCEHSFCYRCITQWYQEFGKSTCPVCREDIQFCIDGDTREFHIQCTRDSTIEDYLVFQNLLDTFRGYETKELDYLRRQTWVHSVIEYRTKNPVYTKYIFNGLQGTHEACHKKRQEKIESNLILKSISESRRSFMRRREY